MIRLLSVLLALLIVATSARADDGAIIIRDTEIENVLKEWMEPVIKAAGLDPSAVHFILVQSKEINAFVAGGQNVFLYSGLLEKTSNPLEVMGVVAHELGHISGGHLVRTRGAMENASYESILGTIAGIGAAIATGNGSVGAALATGAQGVAASKFLSFSRMQESSADQAGLDYLNRAGFSAKGMMTFLEKLESQELLPSSQQSEYIRTHPLTRDRVEAVTAGYERSPHKDTPIPAGWQEQHDRIIAKLVAFVTPTQVAWNYSDHDQSIAAEYARAIAAYRQNHIEEALRRMEGLLKKEPDNPYFLELQGQMLVDFGRVEEALPAYSHSIEVDSKAPLIRIAYAQALVESAGEKNPARLDEAIGQLERAVQDEPRSSRIFRLLATAWGRKGNDPMARLYLAEEALLKQDKNYAQKQAKAAMTGLEKGSRPWVRAQDILLYLEKADFDKKDKDR
jgi:predicted Zn-dependent protease